ncbi:hypothetical protein EYY60_09140 [Flavobacterium zhairuonense]|uniref:hypothetical protein n=1 Tax=Flavobacterium zhairuonense TaxID=2493631 RepID=UPI00104A665F|nr:hypothetical protein [Flavobacterium zhairuonense]KAF2510670.1 hypothetical protein EYY60_09140 [Flavobacterium zhairuonense]
MIDYKNAKYLSIILIFIGFGFSVENSKSGIEIYTIKGNFKTSIKNCYYCFDENSVILNQNPIFDEDDIKDFNWKDQQIFLNESGKKKLKKIKIPLPGMPVVMVLNNKRIYGFWFWDKFSSFGCDRVYTYPEKDFKIKFGLPKKNTFGIDPRFNEVLHKYVIDKYKQY